MGEKRNAYRLLVGKTEGRRPLGKPRRRWVDNIKMDFEEICLSGERGQFSLLSTTEELLGRIVAAPVQNVENTALGIHHADRVAPPIRESWH
jgi:hypothetical protein